MKPTSLIFTLLLIGSSILGAADAPSVKDLDKDESMVVEFSTHGCFHSSQSVFVFTPGKVSIYSLETQEAKDGNGKLEAKKNHLGDVQLSDEEIKKLDALFNFYAKKSRGGCTTIDNIAVSVQKEGKVLKTYEFTDGSCSTYEDESLLTLGELMGRVKKK